MEEILAIFDRRWEQMVKELIAGHEEGTAFDIPDYIQRMTYHLIGRQVTTAESQVWFVLKATTFGYMIKEFGWPFFEDKFSEDLERLLRQQK